MSTGMRQKVSIARAIIHDPPVLIFDEPTAGLDVLVQRAVLRQIAALRDAGQVHPLLDAHHARGRKALRPRGDHAPRADPRRCGTLAELRPKHGQDDLEELFFQLVGDGDEDGLRPESE